MAKVNKEEQARREGMAYALKIAKEKGIEGLEEEIRFRNIIKAPIAISRAKVDDMLVSIKMNVIDTVTILSAMTLRDEFDFGKQRIQRFVERFNLKAECIMDDYTTWDDQIECLREECGLNYVIRRKEDFKK